MCERNFFFVWIIASVSQVLNTNLSLQKNQLTDFSFHSAEIWTRWFCFIERKRPTLRWRQILLDLTATLGLLHGKNSNFWASSLRVLSAKASLKSLFQKNSTILGNCSFCHRIFCDPEPSNLFLRVYVTPWNRRSLHHLTILTFDFQFPYICFTSLVLLSQQQKSQTHWIFKHLIIHPSKHIWLNSDFLYTSQKAINMFIIFPLLPIPQISYHHLRIKCEFFDLRAFNPK